MSDDKLLELITILICFLQNDYGLFSQNSQAMILAGAAGVGKSTFVNKLVKVIKDMGFPLKFYTLRGVKHSNVNTFTNRRHPINIFLNQESPKILLVEEIDRVPPTALSRVLHPIIDDSHNLTIICTATFIRDETVSLNISEQPNISKPNPTFQNLIQHFKT